MLTFQDYYEREIQPQIAAIDIFLKSEEPPYDAEIVGELLDIPPKEWQQIFVNLLPGGVILMSLGTWIKKRNV